MNARAAEALYEAERKGVPQIIGDFQRGSGRCAVGVLEEALSIQELAMIHYEHRGQACPLCGQRNPGGAFMSTGLALIGHLNDDHRLTFSEIARKLGPDSV